MFKWFLKPREARPVKPGFWSRRPRSQAIFTGFGVLSLIALLVAISLIYYAKNIFPQEIKQQQADWIVVLGGESGQRVFGAAELYHQGVAPRVFVSGSGDCRLIVRRLVMAGVPKQHIAHECLSTNTYENAQQVRIHLLASQPKRITLVTSWYHASRALRTFQNEWPEVEWGMHIVYPGVGLRDTLAINEAGAVLLEYVKTLVYALNY